MSAGASSPLLKVYRGLDLLAPAFARSVASAIAECNEGADGGLHAMVYESFRSPELQALYYQRGRTIVPPVKPVTNAPTNLHSWHGYGLAVDVVHSELFWKPPGNEQWFGKVADVFARHNCNWGGNWSRPDYPHFQWHKCTPSPSGTVRDVMTSAGVDEVWRRLDAMG